MLIRTAPWISLIVFLVVVDDAWSLLIPNHSSHTRSVLPLQSKESRNHDADTLPPPVTSAILRVSFDGTRFTGWSAANGQLVNSRSEKVSRRRRRKSRQQLGETLRPQEPGFVRSVEGILREQLAKLYGNVDPSRIVVEGCSRTDSGVHATCMIAQIYCLKAKDAIATEEESDSVSIIPGKRLPHPASPTDDSCFEPLPMNGNLSRMAFSLNRMRPSDVQITGIAPTPDLLPTTNPPQPVFHASLSAQCKSYHYRISTGYVHDPTMQRLVWHVGYSDLNLEQMERACRLLEGTHDFAAFRGAPRGEADKRRYATQDTTCTLSSIRIAKEDDPIAGLYFPGIDPPLQLFKIIVSGDRFLYRMVRLIVGALVAVGHDKLQVEDIGRAVETGSWDIENDAEGRRHQFTCAPAHGLVLHHIDYGDAVHFDWQPLRES